MNPHGRMTEAPSALEAEGVDALSLEAFRTFRDTMRLSGQSMWRRFATKGAHPGQAACLRVLDAHDGISQRDMADHLHVSRPSITAMLKTVEKAGLVVRKPDETDQRLTRVHLTDEGRRLAAELRSVLADYIKDTFATLSEDDRAELIRLLGSLKGRMAQVGEAGTGEREGETETR